METLVMWSMHTLISQLEGELLQFPANTSERMDRPIRETHKPPAHHQEITFLQHISYICTNFDSDCCCPRRNGVRAWAGPSLTQKDRGINQLSLTSTRPDTPFYSEISHSGQALGNWDAPYICTNKEVIHLEKRGQKRVFLYLCFVPACI